MVLIGEDNCNKTQNLFKNLSKSRAHVKLPNLGPSNKYKATKKENILRLRAARIARKEKRIAQRLQKKLRFERMLSRYTTSSGKMILIVSWLRFLPFNVLSEKADFFWYDPYWPNAYLEGFRTEVLFSDVVDHYYPRLERLSLMGPFWDLPYWVTNHETDYSESGYPIWYRFIGAKAFMSYRLHLIQNKTKKSLIRAIDEMRKIAILIEVGLLLEFYFGFFPLTVHKKSTSYGSGKKCYLGPGLLTYAAKKTLKSPLTVQNKSFFFFRKPKKDESAFRLNTPLSLPVGASIDKLTKSLIRLSKANSMPKLSHFGLNPAPLTKRQPHNYFMVFPLEHYRPLRLPKVFTSISPRLKANVSFGCEPFFHQETLFRFSRLSLLNINQELIESEKGGILSFIQLFISSILSDLASLNPINISIKTPWMLNQRFTLIRRKLLRNKLYPTSLQNINFSNVSTMIFSTFMVDRIHLTRKRLRSLPRRARRKLSREKVGRIYLGKLRSV